MIKRQISFLFEDPGFCIDVFCTIAEPVRYYNRDTESGAWYSSTPDWHENGSLIREDLIFEVIANGVVCALDGNGNFEILCVAVCCLNLHVCLIWIYTECYV